MGDDKDGLTIRHRKLGQEAREPGLEIHEGLAVGCPEGGRIVSIDRVELWMLLNDLVMEKPLPVAVVQLPKPGLPPGRRKLRGCCADPLSGLHGPTRITAVEAVNGVTRQGLAGTIRLPLPLLREGGILLALRPVLQVPLRLPVPDEEKGYDGLSRGALLFLAVRTNRVSQPSCP